MAGPVFAAWLGVPLITLIRGNDFDAAVFTIRRRPILDDALARSALICAVTHDKVEKIAALHPRDPNVRWIPNGIDRADWALAPSDRAHARGRGARSATTAASLGLFGQLKAKKGGVFLLDALLRSGVADRFHVLLAGWMEPDMEAWLAEHELEHTTLPFLDRFELLPWYAACDWLAIPSFYDGLPERARRGGRARRPDGRLARGRDGRRARRRPHRAPVRPGRRGPLRVGAAGRGEARRGAPAGDGRRVPRARRDRARRRARARPLRRGAAPQTRRRAPRGP